MTPSVSRRPWRRIHARYPLNEAADIYFWIPMFVYTKSCTCNTPRHGVHRERTQRDRLVKEKNEHEIEITAVEIRDMGYETGREITHLY